MAAPLFRPGDLTDNLVGYWKFNNNGTDSSGKGFDLTGVNTPAYALDEYWSSGEYSTDLVAATPTYWQKTTESDLNLLNQFTIAMWLKGDDVTSVQLLDKGGSTSGYGVMLTASSQIRFIMNNAEHNTTTTVSAGKWTHVVCMYDQAYKHVFIDGNLDYSVAYTTDCTGTTSTLTIGYLAGSSATAYDGHLKDVALWAGTLSSIAIKSLAMGVDLSTYAFRPDDCATAPTAWWKLNAYSGNEEDSVGSHTLTAVSAPPRGKGFIEGVAPNLDGGADYFTAADSDDWYLGTEDFTLMAWVYPDAMAVEDGIISQGNPAGVSDSWKLRIDPAGVGNLEFIVRSSSTNIIDHIWAHGMSNATWHHVALTRSASSFVLYVDGAAGVTKTSSTAVIQIAQTLNIGTDAGNASNRLWDGGICDVAVFKGYAVTAAEMAKLASAFPIQQTGIVSYWNMDDASGGVTDSIGPNDLAETGGTIATASGMVLIARDLDLSSAQAFFVADGGQTGLDVTTTGTIMAWIKPESSTANMAVIAKWDGSNGYALRMMSTNVMQLEINNAGMATTRTLADATWGHVAAFWTGSHKGIYMDGYYAVTAASTTVVSNTAFNFNIGAYSVITQPFDGVVDEVLVASRFFRDEELKVSYTKGLNGLAVDSEPNPAPTASTISRRVFLIT